MNLELFRKDENKEISLTSNTGKGQIKIANLLLEGINHAV